MDEVYNRHSWSEQKLEYIKQIIWVCNTVIGVYDMQILNIYYVLYTIYIMYMVWVHKHKIIHILWVHNTHNTNIYITNSLST